jgi:antitoxin (DNA-binding transcriptional repressor) of toxin-antitoxin stability system
MKIEISTTEAARTLGECLARIRHTGDRYVLTKNHKPVAELVPVSGTREVTLRDMWKAMRDVAADSDFAADLERVNESDEVMRNPWR